MKRIRRCCCYDCGGTPIRLIAESPPEETEWDLTGFQQEKYKKYKKKCWRIEQTDKSPGFFERICTILTGKISNTGKLLDLPDSVTLKGPIDDEYSTARLVVRCSKDCGEVGGCEKCGDPGVNGIVFKTNEGIEGDYWDVSDLIGTKIPKDENGNFYAILSRMAHVGVSYATNPYMEITLAVFNAPGISIDFVITRDDQGIITAIQGLGPHPDTGVDGPLDNILYTRGRYAELYYSCGGGCVPSPMLDAGVRRRSSVAARRSPERND